MRSLKSVFSNDEVFAHPTEGVWGLGCNPFSSKAVENLFKLKKRPLGGLSTHPEVKFLKHI